MLTSLKDSDYTWKHLRDQGFLLFSYFCFRSRLMQLNLAKCIRNFKRKGGFYIFFDNYKVLKRELIDCVCNPLHFSWWLICVKYLPTEPVPKN